MKYKVESKFYKSYRLKYRRPFVSCLQMYNLSKLPICMNNEEYFSILSDNLDSLKYKRGGHYSTGVNIFREGVCKWHLFYGRKMTPIVVE